MASDNLNQIGKYIRKTRQDADFALTRYSRHNPRIERSRDIFDNITPFEMEFEVTEKSRLSLDINFNKPPPTAGCKSNCITSICEKIEEVSGSHYVTLSHTYLNNTVKVFLNGEPVPSTEIRLRPPNSVWVNADLEYNTIVICYIHYSEICAFLEEGQCECGITDSFNRNFRYYETTGSGIFRYDPSGATDVTSDSTSTYSFGLSDAGISWTTSSSPTGVGSQQGVQNEKAFIKGVTAGSWNQSLTLPNIESFDGTITCQMAKFGNDANMNFSMTLSIANAEGAAGRIVLNAMGRIGEEGKVRLTGFGGINQLVDNPLIGRSDIVPKEFYIRITRDVVGTSQNVKCKIWWADEAEPDDWLIEATGTGLSVGQIDPVIAFELSGTHSSGGGSGEYGVRWEFDDINIVGVDGCSTTITPFEDFEREVAAGGWGTSLDGHEWQTFDGNPDPVMSVTGGQGIFDGEFGYAYVSDVNAGVLFNGSFDLLIPVHLESLIGSNGNYTVFSIGADWYAAGSPYVALLISSESGIGTLEIRDASVTSGSSTILYLTSETDFYLRWKRTLNENIDPTPTAGRLNQVRIWAIGDEEPATWDLETNASDDAISDFTVVIEHTDGQSRVVAFDSMDFTGGLAEAVTPFDCGEYV